LRFFLRLLAPLHHLSLVRQGRRTSLDGRHPYQCTIRRYRSWRGFWRGRYNGSNAVISRRRGSRANARGANGWYRNCRRRCGQTHPGILANDGGPGRFDGKARVFRAIINLSQRATRLRQSGGTNHPCGDSQRKNAIRHTPSSEGFHGVPQLYWSFGLNSRCVSRYQFCSAKAKSTHEVDYPDGYRNFGFKPSPFRVSPRRAAAFTLGTSEVWAPKPSKCHAVVIYCVNRPNSSAVLVRVRAVTLSLAYRYLRCSESIRTGAHF
jgi:hypothetical protein